MKTYSAKPSDVKRSWYVVDASVLPLGRLSTVIAGLLTGKGKPIYARHIDVGDYVVVVNADKLVVTGKKMEDKKYYRHSGYPGGIKETSLRDLTEKDATKVIRHAVRGMLPVNKLRADRLARLKIYAGTDHQHSAQQPIELNLSKERK